MHPTSLSIATITWARDAAEESLLRTALSRLSRHRLPVFVADGGSGEGFVEFLRTLRDVSVHHAGRGVFRQAGTSLRLAGESGAEMILYTEPDKLEFFDRGLDTFLENAGAYGDAAVVLAARTPSSFATFPEMQRFTESTINGLCAEVLGVEGDYCYGPLLLHRALLPHLETIQEEIGWGWRFFAVAAAHKLGLEVQLIEGDFPCPADQRSESEKERLYRMTQLEQNIRGLLLGLKSVRPGN